MAKEYNSNLLISDNVPHRTYASKSCYGDSLSDDYIQGVITKKSSTEDVTINNDKEERRSFMKKKLDLLRQIVALLTQKLSQKRLSLRE